MPKNEKKQTVFSLLSWGEIIIKFYYKKKQTVFSLLSWGEIIIKFYYILETILYKKKFKKFFYFLNFFIFLKK